MSKGWPELLFVCSAVGLKIHAPPQRMFYSVFVKGEFNFCEAKEKSLPDTRNSWTRPKLIDFFFFPAFYLWRNTVFLGWGVIVESNDWTNNCFKASARNACQYSNVSWRCDFWLRACIGKSPSIDMVVPGGGKKKALASIFYFAWGGYKL